MLHGAALFGLVTACHCLLLGLVLHGRAARPLLGAVFLANALAMHYMQRYTVYFDPGMMRNILRTDWREARELLSPALLADLALYGLAPALLAWRLPLARRSWKRAVGMRAALLSGAAAVALACLAVDYQELSVQVRSRKEVRYLVLPGSFLVSGARALAADGKHAAAPRAPVGTDARLAASWEGRRKPVLLVLVVGETARAANWGLNGYPRQTTPELAQLDVLNFPHVTACGSSTEVSLPCMFSPFGRRHYDEKAIREHESVLHVLRRAGFRTLWRDNQSGCKGVCAGLEMQALAGSQEPSLCDGERCLDEILLQGMREEVAHTSGNLVVVLHQLGNHGPAYWRRYPPSFRHFSPACENDDLARCSRQEIINSYDNALRYTDHFLARTIALLQSQTSHDAALLYVSDHGESLGENGIYLHGLPYAIAPAEQTGIPMVAWLSSGFTASFRLDRECLRRRAGFPASHDYLFHSLLGLLQVQTRAYEPALDFSAGCRAAALPEGKGP